MRDIDPTASEFISSGYIARSMPGGSVYDPASIMAIGGSLIGSSMQADAAGDAAATQAAATDRANATLERQNQQVRTDLAPWRATGGAANNKLAQLLGLTGVGAMSYDQARTQLTPQYTNKTSGTRQGMVWQQPSGEGDGGWTVGDIPSESSSIDENGLSAAIQQLMAQNAGTQAGGADFGSLLKQFTGADLQNEPGYKFGLDQGMTALDRSLQRGGMMFSGAALKGAQRYGQDYAGTKYGEAFNRDASQKRQAYDFLSGASTSGQNAAAGTANAGTAMAGQIGANTTAMGNAAGASQIAQGNAYSGGIQNSINGYQQNELMNKIMGGNSGFGSSGFGSGGEAWRTSGNGMPAGYRE